MAAAPRYEIRTIRDMTAIPPDRMDAFLVDLKVAVAGLRAINDALGLGTEDFSDDGALIWTDDDEPGGEIRVNCAGERLLTVKVDEHS